MHITITEKEDMVCCAFENDGKIPEEVKFTGGLKTLLRLAENQNAVISVRTGESFCLSLSMHRGSLIN